MPKPRMSCGMLEEVLANVISYPLSAAGEERVDQRSEVGVSKRRAFKAVASCDSRLGAGEGGVYAVIYVCLKVISICIIA